MKNDCILNNNDVAQIKINIIKKNNFSNKNMEEKNKIRNSEMNANKNLVKNNALDKALYINTKEKIIKIKNNYYKIISY